MNLYDHEGMRVPMETDGTTRIPVHVPDSIVFPEEVRDSRPRIATFEEFAADCPMLVTKFEPESPPRRCKFNAQLGVGIVCEENGCVFYYTILSAQKTRIDR